MCLQAREVIERQKVAASTTIATRKHVPHKRRG